MPTLLIRTPKDKDEERLVTVFDEFSRRIKQANTKDGGGTLAEQGYTISYQNLVKAGLAQQIKRKYR